MVELPVDDHVSIQKNANEKYGEFGGTTSIRKPDGAKPVIMFGQDEAAYSQNSFNSEQWVSPTGKRALLPKTGGYTVMVSAMESRETGWGIEITEDLMKKVNDMRKNEKYLDEVAAQAVHGTSDKKTLPMIPLCVYSSSGARMAIGRATTCSYRLRIVSTFFESNMVMSITIGSFSIQAVGT